MYYLFSNDRVFFTINKVFFTIDKYEVFGVICLSNNKVICCT